MEKIEFVTSEDFTIGVELEFQVMDKDSRDLAPLASTVMKSFREHQSIKHEFYESVIEVNSSKCFSIAELKEDLKKNVGDLHKEVKRHNGKLALAGTHPTARWHNQIVSPVQRYLDFAARGQLPIRRMLIYGMHVHIGLNNGQEAIAVNNMLTNFLPYFNALSCSSPYWASRDTGMESYRVKVFETMPTTGLPFLFKSWEEFCDMVNALQKAGSIQSLREIWWDVRPHPGYGTVEIRVCDAMPLFEDTIAIAALIQCTVAYIVKKYRAGERLDILPSFIIRDNKWRAAAHGLNGEAIVSMSGDTSSFRYEIEKHVEKVTPIAKELGCDQDLYKVIDILDRGTSSMRQRKIFKESNENWTELTDSLINEFEESWGLN